MKAIPQPRVLLTDVEAAKLLRLSVSKLRQDRCHQKRIPFLKIGAAVRYDLEHLNKMLSASKVGGSK